MKSFWKGWRCFKGNIRVARDNIDGYVKEVFDKFADVFQSSFGD